MRKHTSGLWLEQMKWELGSQLLSVDSNVVPLLARRLRSQTVDTIGSNIFPFKRLQTLHIKGRGPFIVPYTFLHCDYALASSHVIYILYLEQSHFTRDGKTKSD